MRFTYSCVICFSFFLASSLEAEINLSHTTLIIPQSSSNDTNHEDYYFKQLLSLSISKTREQYGEVLLNEFDVWLSDDRLRAALYKNDIDVIWSVTSRRAESILRPVKIPLLKKMDHYRVLLIRKDDQARFSKVKSLGDLRELTGGMGTQWPDAKIMKHNQLPLIEAPGYGKLFKMLAANRFDYFSRGLYQVKTEVNFYPSLELQIEEDLLLHYPNAFYFFVNRNNLDLAKRIERGLTSAMADGSFDNLFNSIPRYIWAQNELKSGKRRVIELSSPLGIKPMKAM